MSTGNPKPHLTIPEPHRLFGNTAWNLLGFCTPMVVALFAIPVLIHGLGTARFGVLSLVWMLVGYFSIFDLGLGRALTKLVAEKLGHGRVEEVPPLFWTALATTVLLGVTTGLLVWFLTPWLVDHILKIPPNLRDETRWAFKAVAFGMPLAISTAGLVGVLEACQRFRAINTIRIPMGSFNFIGPLCVLPFTHHLLPVVAVLIAARLVEWPLYFRMCLRALPALRQGLILRRAVLGTLLGFGGWMTVSNLAMPLLVHVDRFLIGAILSVTAVTYYVTPAEVVVKLLILPRAWVSVLFPSFSAHFETDRPAVADLFTRSVKYLLAALFPVMLLIVAFCDSGLKFWLGADIAAHSTPVMRWLASGIFVYSLAYIPYSFIQGAGRPDWTAKLHLVEIPLYLLGAPFLIRRIGIEGAAMAWFTRVTLETVLMFFMARRLIPDLWTRLGRALLALLLALALAAATAALPHVGARLALVAVGGGTFMALVWFGIFSVPERQELLRVLDALRLKLKPGQAVEKRSDG